MPIMKSATRLVFFALISTACFAQNKKDDAPKTAQSIAELQQQLEKILQDTHTPGLSVAIVHRDAPEWVAGLGQAGVAAKRATTPDTLFRIGSTSKAFASFSILKLANEGKLSLDDSVHKLVPEAWFQNPWEATENRQRHPRIHHARSRETFLASGSALAFECRLVYGLVPDGLSAQRDGSFHRAPHGGSAYSL
jgi:CubicO group peptidase (beta-lactamase class C family)